MHGELATPRNNSALHVFSLVVAAFIALAASQRLLSQTQKENPPTSQSLGQKTITFIPEGPIALTIMWGDNDKPLMVKNGKGKDVVVEGGATWWRASDGEKVFRTSWNLVTPLFASEYLKSVLLNSQVLKREPMMNEKGETIGERIVGLLYEEIEPRKRGPNDPHKTIPAIIRTEGIHFTKIHSNSMDDNLALEKYLGYNIHSNPQH
jgi:hypothetical protein